MNAKKTLLISSLCILLTANSFGWGVTPHTVIAYLAFNSENKYISDDARSVVIPLLQQNQNFPIPGPVPCTVISGVDNPDNFLASAVAPWPDTIKYIPLSGWGPNASPNAESFYANAHFIDIQFNYGEVANLDTSIALDTVRAQIAADAQQTANQLANDDLYYVLRSCIKSLALSQDPSTKSQISNNEVIFALRHLIHFAGDNTEPLHMSDPMFMQGKTQEDSYGGNEIYFAEPYVTISNNVGSSTIQELHALWDNPGNSFVPLNINTETTQDSEIYINQQSAAQITDVANSIDAMYSSTQWETNIVHNVGCGSDLIMSWATESYMAAVANVFNKLNQPMPAPSLDKQPKIEDRPCRSGYAPDGTILTSASITIPPPTTDYINSLGPVTTLQMYMSAVRLGCLLTAIYDPDNAPETFVNYVNQLKNDNSIPTVNNLMQVY